MPQAAPIIGAIATVAGTGASIAANSKTTQTPFGPSTQFSPTPQGQSPAQALQAQSQSPLLNSQGQLGVPQVPDYSQNLLQMLNSFQQGGRGGNF